MVNFYVVFEVEERYMLVKFLYFLVVISVKCMELFFFLFRNMYFVYLGYLLFYLVFRG